MKNIYLFTLLLLMSCTDNNYISKTLNTADSLINERADSSLKLLKTIEPSELNERENIALYALLKTQATYKNYLPLESDSLIKIAVRYYRSSGDYERYTRSVFYRGIYEMSIDSIGLALETFKNAEDIAVDPYNLAMINFQIGKIYQKQNIFDRAALRYIKAAELFKVVGDLENEGLIYGKLGFVYKFLNNQDSSLMYLNRALDIAKARNDTSDVINYLVMINDNESLFSNNPINGLHNFQEIFNQYNKGIIPTRYRRDLLHWYYAANQLDSARYVALECIERGENPKQRFILYMALIEKTAGNYRQAYDYHVEYTRLSDSLNRVKLDNYATDIEARHDRERLESINKEIEYKYKVLSLIAFALLLALIITFMIQRGRMLKKEQEVSNANLFISNLEANITHIQASVPPANEQVEGALTSGTEIIKQLLKLAFTYRNNEARLYARFSSFMSVKSNRKELLDVLANSVEVKYPHLFEVIATKYLALNESDVTFFGLSIGGFSQQELSVIYQIEQHSVAVRLSRIKRKMGISRGKNITIEDILS